MNDRNLTTNSIKQLLNQSVAEMSTETIASLRSARTHALERHRALQHAPVLAWLNHHGLWVGSSSTSHRNLNWALALILVACLFSGAAYWQQANEHDHSEIDIAILADDLPMDAYVEQ
jgi:type III secretory pathway lipoprotein EscJ